MTTRRAAAGVLILVAGLLLSACAGPGGGNDSGRRITFAFRSDDKPASFVQDVKPTGFMIELTQAMAQKMRVTPSYVATDFASMLPSVRNHTYDSAAFGAQVPRPANRSPTSPSR
ncbi:MAG TPA: transporter substrate-binding domain-containing protein [Pseudonocardia sp.]|uniref:transporter substrate-binding domain-containing protein n=1 Tax=Pseudonocardia sp. TaxID=60912 RepID=UPI002F3F4237